MTVRRVPAAWRVGLVCAALAAGCYVSEAPYPRSAQSAGGTQAPPEQTGEGRVVRNGPAQPTASAGPAAQAGVQEQTEAPSPTAAASEQAPASTEQPPGEGGMSGAEELTLGEEVDGTVSAGEPIWYQFRLAHGQQLRVTAYGQCANEVDHCRSKWTFTVVDPLEGRHHHRSLNASEQPDFHRQRFTWAAPMTSTYYLRVQCGRDDCQSGPVNFKLQTEVRHEERNNPKVWWDPPEGEPLAGGGEGQAVGFAVGQQMLGGTVGPDAPVLYQFDAGARDRFDYRVWVRCADESQEPCRGTLRMTFLDSEGGQVGRRTVNASTPFRSFAAAPWTARGEGTYSLRLECHHCEDTGPLDYVILTRPRE